MKIIYERDDLKKLKDVTLAIDITDNLVTVVISKIYLKASIERNRKQSQIEIISVNSTEIKDEGNYGKTESVQGI